jgi:hypothetical protein
MGMVEVSMDMVEAFMEIVEVSKDMAEVSTKLSRYSYLWKLLSLWKLFEVRMEMGRYLSIEMVEVSMEMIKVESVYATAQDHT